MRCFCCLLLINLFYSGLSLVAQSPISARVAKFNNRPTIFLNDKPEYPMFYSLTDVPGGRWTWEELPRYNMESFCKQGIKLIQVDLAFDHVWKEDGPIDIKLAQRQLRGVLDVCPQAAIFIRFHVNPPKWWQEKNPEENTIYADGPSMPDIDWGLQRLIEDDEENPTRTSLASGKWVRESSDKLKEFLSKLKTTPEGNALAGIQVAGGVYGEWHYWGFIQSDPDMSRPMEVYFRAWLTKKYKTNDALQHAWHDYEVQLSTASLPTLAERNETRGGLFRDPVHEKKVIDYFEAQHQLVADDILHFCKIIKESWPRPIITGAFYGYFYSLFGRDVAGGHLELQRVLKSPYIDYLSAPGTYYPSAVEMGDPYRSRSLINSITLNGKLWLDEMDQQTPLLPLKSTDHAESVKKSIAQVRRNVMFTMSKGQGLWFYDFGPSGFNGGPRLSDHGSFGWWDEPSILGQIKQLKSLGTTQLNQPYKSDADVLLVYDTESFYHMGSDKKRNALNHWGNNWPTVGIFKSGVVHDVIHVADLEKIDLEPYKAIVFVNTFLLKPAQKKTIADKVAKGGRHLVWIYAPGYSDSYLLYSPFIYDVTGIQIEKTEPKKPISITVDSNIVRNYTFSVWDSVISPLFIVKDKEAQSMGTVNGTNQVGFAKKQLDSCTTWFLSLPPSNPELWRYIFKTAGAHIYHEGEAIFYGGNGTLTIHTKTGGTKTITLKNGNKITIDLAPNSTSVINPENGDFLLK